MITGIHSKKITIYNHFDEVKKVLLAFDEFAKTSGIPQLVMLRINKMMNELLSNMIKYGFPKREKGKINIVLELFNSGKLNIEVTANGIPFNPFQLTPPNTEIPLEDRKIGGLGIHLVRKLMDEYNYKRTLDSNVVFMSKNRV